MLSFLGKGAGIEVLRVNRSIRNSRRKTHSHRLTLYAYFTINDYSVHTSSATLSRGGEAAEIEWYFLSFSYMLKSLRFARLFFFSFVHFILFVEFLLSILFSRGVHTINSKQSAYIHIELPTFE